MDSERVNVGSVDLRQITQRQLVAAAVITTAAESLNDSGRKE